MATGIEEIIFSFFQVPPTALSGVMVNDLVNYILLPSVVMLVFLDSAATLFVKHHTSLKLLVELAFFLALVVQGLYAPFAVFAANYVIIFIIFAAAAFFASRFFGERGIKASEGLGVKIATTIDEKREKQKLLKEFQKREANLRHQISQAEGKYNQARHQGDQMLQATWAGNISNLKTELDLVQNEIVRLKRR
jgi:hypothetical protein